MNHLLGEDLFSGGWKHHYCKRLQIQWILTMLINVTGKSHTMETPTGFTAVISYSSGVRHAIYLE